jgi:hypothetical protein
MVWYVADVIKGRWAHTAVADSGTLDTRKIGWNEQHAVDNCCSAPVTALLVQLLQRLKENINIKNAIRKNLLVLPTVKTRTLDLDARKGEHAGSRVGVRMQGHWW